MRVLLSGVLTASFALSIITTTGIAAAQKRGKLPPPQAPGAPPAGPAAPPSTPKDELPPPIMVNDAALAPVPAPQKNLSGWKEAVTMINARGAVSLALAKQDVERAEGTWRQALALALPTITATGSFNSNLLEAPFLIPGVDPDRAKRVVLNGTLTASQPIFAPRAWYGIRTAELQVKAAKLTVEDQRRTILASVAGTIVAVYTAERTAEINRAGLRNALERLDLTQRQLKLGAGTRFDVLRAEQDVAAARGAIVSGDESLRKSREALGLALGANEAYGVPPSITLNDLEQSLKAACPAGPIEKRPDVLAAKTNLEVTKRGVVDTYLAFSPTAQLSTTLNVSNQLITQDKKYAWTIQGTLTIPLWEGGARYGATRIAKAQEEQAKIQLESIMRNASLDAKQALRGVTVADQSKVVAEQARDLAKEASELAKKAYSHGTGTSFDLVDTARKQREAELTLVVREFELVRSRIAALLATSTCTY